MRISLRQYHTFVLGVLTFLLPTTHCFRTIRGSVRAVREEVAAIAGSSASGRMGFSLGPLKTRRDFNFFAGLFLGYRVWDCRNSTVVVLETPIRQLLDFLRKGRDYCNVMCIWVHYRYHDAWNALLLYVFSGMWKFD